MDEPKKVEQMAPEQSVATPKAKEVPVNTPVPAPEENILSAGSKRFDNTFSELQAIQNNVKSFRPGDIVVPLMSIITLGLLTTFVYIPMVTAGTKFRQESAEISEKIKKLEDLNDDLDKMDVSLLQTDLANSRVVIPFSLQVSDFVSYIDDAATDKGLEFKEILAGDIAIKDDKGDRGIDKAIKGVSGPLKYVGTLNQITDFLDELQVASPFILSADQIKLKKENSGEKWEIAVNITGYYINQASLTKTNLYNNFVPYTQYEDTLNIFKLKSEKIK
jgi:hypothetical protein